MDNQMDLFTGTATTEPGKPVRRPAGPRFEPYSGQNPCVMCVAAQAAAYAAGKPLPDRRRPRWRLTTQDAIPQVLCERVTTQAEHDR